MCLRNMIFTLACLILVSEACCANTLEQMIVRAGNAESDEVRLEILKQLHPMVAENQLLLKQHDRILAEIEKWIHDPHLYYFSGSVFDGSKYPFDIPEESPFYPIVQLYQARMIVWVVLEYGELWSNDVKRVRRLAQARHIFEQLKSEFPKNRIIRMYLGEPMPSDIHYAASARAPAWANAQRESLERMTDIIHWWIDHRMQDNGEYGGGWDDDCEMWRWWMPVLIGFDDPKLTNAQDRFSTALLSQPYMTDGYTNRMSDVEHTAEDAADAITPMMLLKPDNADWAMRAQRLAELMRDLWTGINERGQLQFKTTYFTAEKIDLTPRKACDTVYHPRAVQPALLYWQRTGDKMMGELFTAWMDTWVDATARSERGKPAGVIPSAIHWPDGAIGGLGEQWWKPGNYTDDPLYVWPSAMPMMTNTLLLTWHMTGQSKYLEPIQSMADIRLEYLNTSRVDNPVPGSVEWCGAKMAAISDVVSKYNSALIRRLFSPK